MYAKIVTLLALLFGSLSGVATASQSAIGDHSAADSLIGKVQLPFSQDETETAEEREEPSEGEPAFEPSAGCHTTEEVVNAEAGALAAELGASYESVLKWFCAGYSEPAIQIAYDMSVMGGVSLEEIFQMRMVEKLSWSEIAETLGLPGEHSAWVSGAPQEEDGTGGELPEGDTEPARPER